MSGPERPVPASNEGPPSAEVVVAALHAALVSRSATIASAESLTGGALGGLLSSAPGASDSYLGGVVSYATALKKQLLGVTDRTVAEDGVVSARCAAQMATGVRSLVGADYAVSTTGVAGPDGQEGKPVGLVFVGVAGPQGVSTRELHLSGDRSEIRKRTCREAVVTVLEMIRGEGG